MGPNHHHFFSPLCFDEVHGRFDSVDDGEGRCWMLDVGTGAETAFATYAEAREAARRAALAHRADPGLLLRVEGLAAETWTRDHPEGPAWTDLDDGSFEKLRARQDAWDAAAARRLPPCETAGPGPWHLEPEAAPPGGSGAGSAAVEEVRALLRRIGGGSLAAGARAVLPALVDEDPDIAQDRPFAVFEDLDAAGPEILEAAVEAVGRTNVVLALKGASAAAKERFWNVLPAFSADQIREEMAAAGVVRIRDVDAAQRRIVRAANAAARALGYHRPDGDDDLIY